MVKEDIMTKLYKNTRDMIKVGTVLHDGAFSAKVTNVIPSGKGLCITLQILDGDLAGRQLYAEPLSTYYGCEIKEA